MKYPAACFGLSLILAAAPLGAQSLDAIANTRTPLGVKTQAINNTPKAEAAPTPPMGWNSWDDFGLEIDEAEFKAQVDYASAHLKSLGYTYMVIDAGWYARHLTADRSDPYASENQQRYPTEVDAYGRWIPVTSRFPSAADGTFRALADYVHGKGLKFGLHIQRGIPWTAVEKNLPIKGTPWHARDIANPADCCPWFDGTVGIDMSKPGAQEYYDSCYETYAQWGLDFVKVDDLSRPYHADEVTAIRLAIEHSGRPMVFSLSPGPAPISVRAHVQNNGDMWRVSVDFWDTWAQLKAQFAMIRPWLPVARPGRWADLDMLPIGTIGDRGAGPPIGVRRSRLTPAETQTMMTLWCMVHSPLILGGNLNLLTEADLKFITDPDLLRIDQGNARCREAVNQPEAIAYVAEQPGGAETYVAYFNLSDSGKKLSWSTERLRISGPKSVRKVWSEQPATTLSSQLEAEVEPHGVALFVLKSS